MGPASRVSRTVLRACRRKRSSMRPKAEAPLAGRERRDPAADGAQLPRLRLVTEGEATPGERRLEGRSGGAGADRGQAAPPVEIAQAGQVHGEHGAVAEARGVTPPTTLVPPPNGSPRRPPRPHRRGGRGPGHRPQTSGPSALPAARAKPSRAGFGREHDAGGLRTPCRRGRAAGAWEGRPARSSSAASGGRG